MNFLLGGINKTVVISHQESEPLYDGIMARLKKLGIAPDDYSYHNCWPYIVIKNNEIVNQRAHAPINCTELTLTDLYTIRPTVQITLPRSKIHVHREDIPALREILTEMCKCRSATLPVFT